MVFSLAVYSTDLFKLKRYRFSTYTKQNASNRMQQLALLCIKTIKIKMSL